MQLFYYLSTKKGATKAPFLFDFLLVPTLERGNEVSLLYG